MGVGGAIGIHTPPDECFIPYLVGGTGKKEESQDVTVLSHTHTGPVGIHCQAVHIPKSGKVTRTL